MPTRKDDGKRTRAALTAAGRRLFVEQGYYETSTEELVAAAGVGTRGALYHHFEDKRALFRAVFLEVLEDFAARGGIPSDGEAEPLDRLRMGLRHFLAAATEPEVQRIVLIDGPTVLGWEELRALEEPTVVSTLRDLLEKAVDAGVVRDQSIDTLARILLGAIQESGLMMRRADEATASAIRDALDALVLGLRSPAT